MIPAQNFQMGGNGILLPAQSAPITNLDFLFASGEDGYWFDKSDASTLWQDTTGTTPVTTTGQAIARVDDKSPNAHNTIQATGSLQPAWNSAGYSEHVGDCLGITGSASTLKWLHGDGAIAVALLVRIGTTANPNATYTIMGSNGTSGSKTGFEVRYDDRADQARNNALIVTVTYSWGGSSFAYQIAVNDLLPADTNLSIILSKPAGGTMTAYVDGISSATSARLAAPSSANSTHDLQQGASGGNIVPYTGRIYQEVIRDKELSPTERANILAFFATKG